MKKIRRTLFPILLKSYFSFRDYLKKWRNNPLQSSPIDYKQIGNIIIFGTTAVGDTLFGTPAARAVKESLPWVRVTWVAHANSCEVLLENPYIDEILSYSHKLGEVLRLYKRLRSKRYDVVFMFHNTDRMVWLLAKLLGAREVIGYRNFNSKQMDYILTRSLTLEYGKMHAAEYYLELVKLIGAETKNRELILNLGQREMQDAVEYLRQSGAAPADTLIGIQAGAANSYKCWPKEKFAQLANDLTAKMDCRIVITGGSNDLEIVNYLQKNVKEQPIISAGKLTIRQTAALIKHLSLFVSNDTGPMHLAFCAGTPTIALFCPTDPMATGPFGCEDRHIIIKKPKPCEPCLNQSCRNAFCMDQISVGEVMAAVHLLLTKKESIRKQ